MGFIKFTHTGKSYEPKCSINSRGTIAFNEGAKKRYRMNNYNYVELYFDKETNRIGLKLREEQGEGALKLRQRKFGVDIGAKNFLNFFNIDFNVTKSYKIIFNEMNNFIVLNLDEGIERKIKRRKRNKEDLGTGFIEEVPDEVPF